MTFPAYPEVKDSGVEWLGEVPAHWEVVKLGYLATSKGGGTPPKDELQYWNGSIPWVTPKDMKQQRITSTIDTLSEAALPVSPVSMIEPGHVLIVFRSGILRHRIPVAINQVPVTVNQDVRAYNVRPRLLPDFFLRLTQGLNRELLPEWSKQGTTVESLDSELVSSTQLPVPPRGEQEQIAAFLDYQTARIDALVEQQQRLIALLKEKRQAVISHAVTKGLDPDVPMKDSGVEWLGEVPAHWGIMKFLRCVKIAEGQVDPKLEEHREKILIAPNHVESATGRILGLETAESQGAESGKYMCQAGDVAYSKIRPALRKACVIDREVLCSADMYPLRPLSKLSSEYLLWSILSEPFSRLTILESERVAMPKINRESLNEIYMAVPPLGEQKRISGHIFLETQRLDQLTSIAVETIELLSERRSSLISAAVTGKIDVRGWTPPADAAPAQRYARMEAV